MRGHFYIDGVWSTPVDRTKIDVVNPATERAIGAISLGTAQDVDRAVRAARLAFFEFSRTDAEYRIALLRRILACFAQKQRAIGEILSQEMGAPLRFAIESQAGSGVAHLEQTIGAMESFPIEYDAGRTRIVREPIGVVGMITPWNWPINQIVCKVAPAIAAGCCMVLKPSEIAPFNAILFAEVLEDAGVPKGVFNLVNGDGPTVGAALAAHSDVDMISFTGSTRAGVSVAKLGADSIKRVHQELGGKSANIVLEDADLEVAVAKGVRACFGNSGQSCNAPTRMLVHADQHDAALEIARRTAATINVGDPALEGTMLGPVVSRTHFEKIQGLIAAGLNEGARLVAGGLGRPDGLAVGYYVRPTVFADVTPRMMIAREEIFGPVLSILPYRNEEDAIQIANDTPYGLAAYVQSRAPARARRVAYRLRAGTVSINYPASDDAAPFGGYKQSGNGRECGKWGIEEFLETKAIIGFN
jgi:aldehyde dehydrogenase (NAD+)